jgi:hypothetical protein
MSHINYHLGEKQFQVYVHDSIIVCYKIDITNYCEDDICETCIDAMFESNRMSFDTYESNAPFISFSGCTCSEDDVRFGYRLMIVTIPNKDVKPQDSLYTIHYSVVESIKNCDFVQHLASLTLPNIEVFSVQKTMDSFDDVTCATIKKFNDGFKTKEIPIVLLNVCDGSKKSPQFLTHFQSIFESILTQKSKPITKENPHIGLKKKMTK